MSERNGMAYAPSGPARPVVGPDVFVFAAVGLEHGHIHGMCNGLTEAGATLKWVYDPDAAKVDAFRKAWPAARAARCEAEVLDDPAVHLVAGAAVPSRRCALGLRVMEAGKDYFTDKAPMTTLDHVAAARRAVTRTGRKYAVYYSERLHVESAVHAGTLIEQGAIGRVVHVLGTGPHRISIDSRPAWFFERESYGGILCDIGSHQIEQFLHFAGAGDASVLHSKVANYRYKTHAELEDFGDATLLADNGATCYFRVDWLTADGLRTWGDGRTIVLGTHGHIELRKYIEVAREDGPDQLYLVNDECEQHLSLRGKVGFPFFGQLIGDCMNRTEEAMTQEHAFKAAELCIQAQARAVRVE